MTRLRLGIYGYGNLGRGVECAASHSEDVELCAIFTRRDPADIQPLGASVPVLPARGVAAWKDKLDVLAICGGSANDLPAMTPALAKDFCVIDSFDTHARIPEHFAAVEEAALSGDRLALISCGWDPGLFSLERLLGECILPGSSAYTFWGKGVSQGHSDAIRRVAGVADARQYTIPCKAAMDAVCSGSEPVLSAREKHMRECFVVLEPGADPAAVEREIVNMPNYFSDYDTTVHFISQMELERDHGALPHGGFVLRSGRTGAELEHRAAMEYSLRLDSNPEFTGAVLVAFARAVCRMYARGRRGCISVFDVAPAELSPGSAEELRAQLL